MLTEIMRRPDINGEFTEPALRVLRERYLWRKDGEIIETPEEMYWRVATTIAESERPYLENLGTKQYIDTAVYTTAVDFYKLMVSHKFLPNSPTLMNAGKNNGLQYSACYVLPIDDSLVGIFDTIRDAAVIHQSGGGTGFAFSRLRSSKAIIGSTGYKSSGPISFLKVYNAATEAVKQGGTRRGANMAILRVDHPDIIDFINCKNDGGILNFNISVGITDEFMSAIANDKLFELREPHTGEITETIKASIIWDTIIDSAWRTGDPGLVFLDKMNNSPANPTPNLWLIEATNPCGEQPLAPYEACNLGSINVAKFFLDNPSTYLRDKIDWNSLRKAVETAVHFLDNVIDANPYPLPAIDKMVKGNRRIGLGIMGWADLLVMMELPYDSQEARDFALTLMRYINEYAVSETERLGQLRGNFPNLSQSIYRKEEFRRNSTVTTIAPTGSISIIAGCSSGIEPYFALAYKHIVGERELIFTNPLLEVALLELIPNYSSIFIEELKENIAKTGTLSVLDEYINTTESVEVRRSLKKLQGMFQTAHEVEPVCHVLMQAAFQMYTENAVSKTINLPHDATRAGIASAYHNAYDNGCLGITVFRDGCKGEEGQVLHTGIKEKVTTNDGDENTLWIATGEPVEVFTLPDRPSVINGYTRQLIAPEGRINVTVNSLPNNDPFEVFINVGKAGSDIAALAEAVGRLVSLVLRLPSSVSVRGKVVEIIDQLKGIGGSRTVGFGEQQVKSLPDAVAKVLSYHAIGEEIAWKSTVYQNTDTIKIAKPLGNLCPDCGCNTLFYSEGCKKCEACGFSEC